MASKLLTALAWTASCTATVLPRAPAQSSAKSWVSLPITHEHRMRTIHSKRDQDVPLFNVSSVSYLIELSIGTPGQTVKVAIDTGSDELWVNPDCTSSDLTTGQQRECVSNKQYDPDTSSTATVFSNTTTIQYGKGKVALQYVEDNIALPDSTIKVKDAMFGVATQSEELNEGILGLGWGNGFNLRYNNFIDDLAEQNITNSRAFSVALGSVDANNGGTLIFGGVDTKKFTGPLVTNSILAPQGQDSLYRYWIEMTGISLTRSGKSTPYSGTHLPVVLDSGSSLSYLPSSIVSAMASDFNGQYSRANQLYLVPCSQTQKEGTLDFAFNDITIQVPFDEFIWQYDSSTCVLGAVPVDPDTGITALLGDTFMRSAFAVFDQTQKTISLAQYANCGENEQAIPASGVGNLTGDCKAKASAAGRTSHSSSLALTTALVIGVLMSVL